MCAPGEVIQMDSGRMFDDSEHSKVSSSPEQQPCAIVKQEKARSQSRGGPRYHERKVSHASYFEASEQKFDESLIETQRENLSSFQRPSSTVKNISDQGEERIQKGHFGSTRIQISIPEEKRVGSSPSILSEDEDFIRIQEVTLQATNKETPGLELQATQFVSQENLQPLENLCRVGNQVSVEEEEQVMPEQAKMEQERQIQPESNQTFGPVKKFRKSSETAKGPIAIIDSKSLFFDKKKVYSSQQYENYLGAKINNENKSLSQSQKLTTKPKQTSFDHSKSKQQQSLSKQGQSQNQTFISSMIEDVNLSSSQNNATHHVPKEIQKARQSLIVSQLSPASSQISAEQQLPAPRRSMVDDPLQKYLQPLSFQIDKNTQLLDVQSYTNSQDEIRPKSQENTALGSMKLSQKELIQSRCKYYSFSNQQIELGSNRRHSQHVQEAQQDAIYYESPQVARRPKSSAQTPHSVKLKFQQTIRSQKNQTPQPQSSVKQIRRKRARSTYGCASMTNILFTAIKEDGLVKEWRKRELANKKHPGPTIIRQRSQSIRDSPTPKLKSDSYYQSYVHKKVKLWLSERYLTEDQVVNGLSFLEFTQYLLVIGFSRGIEDEVLLLLIYLMFLNRLKDGKFGDMYPENEYSEVFTETRISVQDLKVLLMCIMDLRDANLMGGYILYNKHCNEKFSASYKSTYRLWVAKDFQQFFLIVQALRLNFRNSEKFAKTQKLKKRLHKNQMGISVNTFSGTTDFRPKHRLKGSTYIFYNEGSLLRQPSEDRQVRSYQERPVSGLRKAKQAQPTMPLGQLIQESTTQLPLDIETYPLLYLEVHLQDGNLAPLIILQRDEYLQKTEEFCDDHGLDECQRREVIQAVEEKIQQLQDFAPMESEFGSQRQMAWK